MITMSDVDKLVNLIHQPKSMNDEDYEFLKDITHGNWETENLIECEKETMIRIANEIIAKGRGCHPDDIVSFAELYIKSTDY